MTARLISASFNKNVTLLLKMGRSKADIEQAKKAADAMHSGETTYSVAADTVGVSPAPMCKRLKGVVGMQA